MRITAGKFKNQEVLSYKDKNGELRPTSSKVRQAVFNLLNHGKFLRDIAFLDDKNPSLIHDRVVADIYCGTGIMGFEAASRGAGQLIFVDKNPLTLGIAKKSAAKLGAMENSIFIRADATNLPIAPKQADIIFLDPPYEKALAIPTLQSIAKNGWLRDGGIAIVEHSKREDVEGYQPFIFLDKREYNNSFITILKLPIKISA